MLLTGIEALRFGVLEPQLCARFFTDFGLTPVDAAGTVFETLNGARVLLTPADTAGLAPGLEPDPTVREVTWGVADAAALAALRLRLSGVEGLAEDGDGLRCTDPAGLGLRFVVSTRRSVELPCARTNTWAERRRVDAPSPAYERATPVEIGHVVLFVKDLEASSRFYRERLGFWLSDQYPGRGHFLRCSGHGGHHNLFLLQTPEGRAGLNHVAFTVRDLHEVIGGGLNMSRRGWETELGPGRHPISSAMFWYFQSPAGALVEYYTDEDELTPAWQPRDFTPGPTVFAEWAIKGGIDGQTRRQKHAEAPSGRFMTDTQK